MKSRYLSYIFYTAHTRETAAMTPQGISCEYITNNNSVTSC